MVETTGRMLLFMLLLACVGHDSHEVHHTRNKAFFWMRFLGGFSSSEGCLLARVKMEMTNVYQLRRSHTLLSTTSVFAWNVLAIIADTSTLHLIHCIAFEGKFFADK